MAASQWGSPSPEIRKLALRKRYSHERQSFQTASRCDRTSRRPQGQYSREWPTRYAPSQELHQCQLQLQTSVTIPVGSTLSVNAPVEHHGLAMERTPSGNSIISDDTFEPQHNYTLIPCSDREAACSVKSCFKSLATHGHNKHVRYLRTLIESPVDLDDQALDSILIGADAVFFDGALSGRVRWEWSHPSQLRYETELIGTTALRPASPPLGYGYETLIVLSRPILCNPDYDRRLLLSAFLHELVHCYLFIRCGFEARIKGGHTEGFHSIAELIDAWVGACGVNIQLCNMKANLDHFRIDQQVALPNSWIKVFRDRGHTHEGCNQSPRPDMCSLEEMGIGKDARAQGWE